MISTMQMYWLVMLDNFVSTCLTIAFISGVTAFVVVPTTINDIVRPWVPVVLGIVAAFFLMVATFTPSTKQMAAIIIVPKIANSEKVQTVGNKLYDLAVEWMDELKPNRAKERGEK